MGGLAEDALLYQQLSGRHADLDVLTQRPQLDEQLARLMALGLDQPAGERAWTPGRPVTLRVGRTMSPVEVWVSMPEPGGRHSLDLEGGPARKRFRMLLPEDTFQTPATTIAGIPIQTVSPLALYQLRAVSAQTRGGEKQARDLAMQALLRRAFLTGVDERDLGPRLVWL